MRKFADSCNQAVTTPSNGSSLFNKMRVGSEQKLGRAALGYLIEKRVGEQANLHDPEVTTEILNLLHPGPAPLPTASAQEKADFKVRENASNNFWHEFLHTPEARKASNTTTYLHTHAHHANGFATRFILRVGRLAGELGHVILAPSTLFTKMYRYMQDGMGSSNGIVKSALYMLGTLTTLSLLAAFRTSEVAATIPFSITVLFPLYSLAAASCFLGKALDSLSYRLSVKKPINSEAMISMREGAQNRLMEQLTNLAKLQNHLANKTGESDQIFVEMAKDLAQEKMNSKSSTLTGRLGTLFTRPLSSDATRAVQDDAGTLHNALLFARLPDDNNLIAQPDQASVHSITHQIVSKHAQGLDQLDAIGQATDRNRGQLLKTELRSLASAVAVFTGPHCKGINAVHARADDFDRYYRPGEADYDPTRPFKVRLGDHPFPDKQVREHLECLTAALFDKVRLSTARALCFVSNTQLHKSNKNTVFNQLGQEVKEYRGIRGAIHRSARLLSMNADTSQSNPVQSSVPAPIRSWVVQKPGHTIYNVKQVRESARKPAPAGSLKDIGLNAQNYSGLTQALYKAHKNLEFLA
ncbi:MAG: hypothetical protein R3194_10625, partial [Limnobacter sp.]|nr:hypothetical protein [Limnobacter sp.]